jgi:hypothetical protein
MRKQQVTIGFKRFDIKQTDGGASMSEVCKITLHQPINRAGLINDR